MGNVGSPVVQAIDGTGGVMKTFGCLLILILFAVSMQTFADDNTVKIGDSIDRVKTILGEPNGTLEGGHLQILTYSDREIDVRDGKVAKITPMTPHSESPAPVQPVPDQPAPLTNPSPSATNAGKRLEAATDPGTESVLNSNVPSINDRQYISQHPLYIHLVLGNDASASMIGALDESRGTGAGYDTVYIDENMNNDLNDEQPKTFPANNNEPPGFQQKFSLKGPGPGGTAVYTLTPYNLNGSRRNTTSSLLQLGHGDCRVALYSDQRFDEVLFIRRRGIPKRTFSAWRQMRVERELFHKQGECVHKRFTKGCQQRQCMGSYGRKKGNCS